MFRLLKWLIVLACLAVVAYFAFFVPLGDRTLYQHVVGISKTDEARELKDELAKKAQGVKEGVAAKLPAMGASPGPADAGAPLSELSEKDRRALRDLLRRAEAAPKK